MKKLKNAETPLEKRVQRILNSKVGEDYTIKNVMEDLSHGCSSGFVNELIYYCDTVKWYKKYLDEINDLLKETLDDCGYKGLSEIFGKNFDKDDPLCIDTHNQNLLAWFSFEETANRLASKNNIEW